MSTLRGSIILVAFFAFTLALMPVQAVLLALQLPAARWLPCWYHRRIVRLVGLRLAVEGAIERSRPVLIVANHVSWLDIPALSALAPLAFIAKREVGAWPFIGWLARLQRSVFVDRQDPRSAAAQTNVIAERLAAGDTLVLFAEGTTGDGNAVLPFKSTLLAAAKRGRKSMPTTDEPPVVQTLTIAYTHLHGLPLGRAGRPHVAWYGDMEVPGHAWKVLKSGPIDARITIGAPVALEAFADRKALANHAEKEVRERFAALLRPRPPTRS